MTKLGILLAFPAAALVSGLPMGPAFAQDATWNGTTSEWTAPGNWSPASLPTGTATFGATGSTTVENAGGAVSLGEVLFTAGAQQYQIGVANAFTLTGAGVVNNSGTLQLIGVAEGQTLTFQNSASASAGSTALPLGGFLGLGGSFGVAYESGGTITFNNSSTAGTAVILTGGTSSINFNQTSTAGNALILNGFFSGVSNTITFNNASSAGNAQILSVGAISFNGTSTAGNALIEVASSGGSTSTVNFNGSSTAGNATIDVGGNSLGFSSVGAVLNFNVASTGGTARIIADAGNIVDISNLTTSGITVGSIEGAGTFNLGSKTLTVGSNNLSTTVSGLIADGGIGGGTGASLVKIGTGTLTLTGINDYFGATTVNGGTLEVDGSIAASNSVHVNSGGTLSGTGVVSGTSISAGGTLAPGPANGIGTLGVIGSLTFASGALYMVQVSGANADLTNVGRVGGSAFLAGNVQVGMIGSAKANTSYDILHAAGGLNGTTFAGVQALNFKGALSYSATDVFLSLTANLGGGSGLGASQQHVANIINNAFNSGGPLPPGFFNLFQLSGASLSSALTQVAGETATGSQQTTFGAMGQFMGLMTDPFLGRGGGINGSNAAVGFAATSNPTDAFAMFTKAPPQSFEQRWNVWASAFGGSQGTEGNAAAGTNNTTSNIFGTAVGADYRVSAHTLVGFALAGGGTNFTVIGGGTGRSDLFQFGTYFRHTSGPAYITGALAYGWQDITTNRTVTVAGFDQLRARFDANSWSGRLEGGYRFVSPATLGVGITPYAAAQFVSFDLPAYAEQAIVGSNAFALNYGAHDATDARSELGVRADKSWVVTEGLMTLSGRLAWAHDYDPNRSISATFQSLPGASFVANGAAQAADSALTTSSIEIKWRSGWSAAATFEGEFSNVTSSYAGKGVVKYQW